MSNKVGSLLTITHASCYSDADHARFVVRSRVRRMWFVLTALAAMVWTLALPWSGELLRNAFLMTVGGIMWAAAAIVLVVDEARQRRYRSGIVDVSSRCLDRVEGFRQVTWERLSIPPGSVFVIERFRQLARTRAGEQSVGRTRLVLDPCPVETADEWLAWASHVSGRVWLTPPNPPPGTRLVLPPLPACTITFAAEQFAKHANARVVDLEKLESSTPWQGDPPHGRNAPARCGDVDDESAHAPP